MMIRALLLVSIGLSAFAARAQPGAYTGFPSLVWPKLYNITFIEGRDELGTYQKPVFTEAVRALEGKTIVLPGYMVPLDNVTSSSQIMLSSLPLNACFFCGVGGPETAVEVNLASPSGWLENPIEVKGVLRLNDADPDRLYYILERAEILGPVR